jgi:hypothetical protein
LHRPEEILPDSWDHGKRQYVIFKSRLPPGSILDRLDDVRRLNIPLTDQVSNDASQLDALRTMVAQFFKYPMGTEDTGNFDARSVSTQAGDAAPACACQIQGVHPKRARRDELS